MVHKIKSTEYLMRYGNMSAAERISYKSSVGEWLQNGGRYLMVRAEDANARLKDVISLSAEWNDAECVAFEQGARLMTAVLNISQTWLPELLYVKSARRSIRQMVKVLSDVEERELKHFNIQENQPNRSTTLHVENTTNQAVVSTDSHTSASAAPVRPKHIDQYAHLLPKGTQERAGAVRGLLRELDEAREKMRLLMEDANAKPDARAAWAKKATKIDSTLKGIYKELDAEWEKLVESGRITVDAFGNASLSPDPSPIGRGVITDGRQEAGASTPLPMGEGMGERPLTSEQKHRRRELRKWLIDLRRGGEGKAREKRIDQWRVNWAEYLTLEPLELALKDEKIVAAAAHFGISLAPLEVKNEK